MGRRADVDTESFGALLRRYRGRRGLTQEELAERAGLHAQQISQLERGVIRSPRSTTVEFLAEALRLDPQERAIFVAAARGESVSSAALVDESGPARQPNAETLLASIPVDVLPARGPLPAGSRMPLAPNPLFVGRGDELLQVAAALRGGATTVALGQVVASIGLGGLGKTQMAVELVHRYGRFFAGGVNWLSFASADEIPLQVAACAAPELESRSLEERVRLVTTAWQDSVPRLLVFDNCEEEALLEAWRPTSGGCRVLVTSRRSSWSPTLGVTVLPLDLLPRMDSIELLRRYRPDLPAGDPGLDAIAQELGDLPLALHLAGSYLSAYRAQVSLEDYLTELRRSEVVHHASLLGGGLDDAPSPTHHVQGVAQTFALCLGRLDRARPADRVAIALLARLACLAPGERVPRNLLDRSLEEVGPLERADGFRRLGALGLADDDGGWLRLHRLLAHFVRQEALDVRAGVAVDRALVGGVSAALDRRQGGSAIAAMVPHLTHRVAEATVEFGADEQRLAELCSAAGRALQSASMLSAARPVLERALQMYERVLGLEHAVTAASLVDLAGLLRAQGDLFGARLLLERSLAIRERVLGPDHPDTARSLTSLAFLLQDGGDMAAGLPLLERALAIRERVLGPDHPDTAINLGNLATQEYHLGHLSTARPLLKRALATWDRLLESGHTDGGGRALARIEGVLAADHHRDAPINYLALMLGPEDLSAVISLFERAAVISERKLGPAHPDIAAGLSNLALLLQAQGELVAARPLLERALAIREQVLGGDHARTATSLNNLAGVLRAQGEPAAAKSLLKRALAIRERVLGPEHLHTAQLLGNLALVLQDLGEMAAARSLLERALGIRERVLGPDHPDTTNSLDNLGSLFHAEGDVDAARLLLERVLTIRERVLGRDHPYTAVSLTRLADLLLAQRDPAAARPLFERALAIRERVLGPEHPDTVATRRALAELAAEADGAASAEG